jgi:alpha-L-fucosidase
LKQKIRKAYSFEGKQPVKYKQLPEGTFVYMAGVPVTGPDTIIQFEMQ